MSFVVTVSNTGRAPLENVTVVDEYPEGIRPTSQNSATLGMLAAGDSQDVIFTGVAEQPGTFTNTARATADGRDFAVTTWMTWAPDLLDPTHPVRVEMDEHGIDRVILTVVSDVAAFARLSRPSPSTA